MKKFPVLTAVAAAAAFTCSTFPAAAAPLLAVDMNDRTVADSPNSPPDFSAFTLTGTTGAVGSTSRDLGGGYSLPLRRLMPPELLKEASTIAIGRHPTRRPH